MSARPPSGSQAPPPPGYRSAAYGGVIGPQVPVLNAELLFFLAVWGVIGIISLASDSVGTGDFVLASVVLGSAYLISRGIAKAGKVVEPE